MLISLLTAALLAVSSPQRAYSASPATIHMQPFAVIENQSVTPSTIGFTASNPDTNPTVGGSANSIVQFTAGTGSGSWSLQVSAPPAFASCSTVPAGAVRATATCTSKPAGATCAATSTAISATATTIASGNENSGGGAYTITISFTFSDSWQYIASSLCSLNVTYTINA